MYINNIPYETSTQAQKGLNIKGYRGDSSQGVPKTMGSQIYSTGPDLARVPPPGYTCFRCGVKYVLWIFQCSF